MCVVHSVVRVLYTASGRTAATDSVATERNGQTSLRQRQAL